MTSLTNYLNRCGLAQVGPNRFLSIALIASLLVIGLVSSLTSSLTIALALYLCMFVQCLDLLRVRREKLQLKQDGSWPKFLDAIHSSVWSGASLANALTDSNRFVPTGTQWAFAELEQDLTAGLDFDEVLVNLKVRLANPISDRFVELTRLANQIGGHGYLVALRAQASQLRAEHASWEEINSKQNWVIGSARLAVFAPWLILLLLSSRPETASAFNSELGLFILVFGLSATLCAFKLVRFLAKLPKRQRILGA